MNNEYASWRRGRARRLPKHCYRPGHPVHVTLCAVRYTQPFRDSLAAAALALLLDDTRTLAACVMPDHVHWLLSDASTMVPAIQSFKSRSARYARALGYRHRLWQRSYHDRLIRKRDNLHRVAGYIVDNPLRAGLATRISDYPHQAILTQRFPPGW